MTKKNRVWILIAITAFALFILGALIFLGPKGDDREVPSPGPSTSAGTSPTPTQSPISSSADVPQSTPDTNKVNFVDSDLKEEILALEVPKEVEKAFRDGLYADARYYASMKNTLMLSNGPDPEPRGGYIKGMIRQVSPETQPLRILLWVRETEPELRKELLKQWFLFHDPPLIAQATKSRLKALLRGRTEEAVSQRMQEFDEVCQNFDKVGESLSGIKLTTGSVPEPLETLDEKILLADPATNAGKRRDMYASMPPIREIEGFLDDSLLGFYHLLWIFEQSPDLRKDVLIPALKKINPLTGYPDNYLDKCIKPLLTEMTEEEKKIRLDEMRAAFPAEEK